MKSNTRRAASGDEGRRGELSCAVVAVVVVVAVLAVIAVVAVVAGALSWAMTETELPCSLFTTRC